MSLVSGLAVVTVPRTLIDPLFSCSSRRLLEQQSRQPSRGAAQQQHSGQPQQQLGLPGCEHDYRQSWGDSFLSGVHLSSRVDHDEHGRGPRRAGRPIPQRRLSWLPRGRQAPLAFLDCETAYNNRYPRCTSATRVLTVWADFVYRWRIAMTRLVVQAFPLFTEAAVGNRGKIGRAHV